jgi:hypothetical protein
MESLTARHHRTGPMSGAYRSREQELASALIRLTSFSPHRSARPPRPPAGRPNEVLVQPPAGKERLTFVESVTPRKGAPVNHRLVPDGDVRFSFPADTAWPRAASWWRRSGGPRGGLRKDICPGPRRGRAGGG